MKDGKEGSENNILDEVKIVYEDSDCAVLFKPAGLPVHGDGMHDFVSLVDFVHMRYPEATHVGEKGYAPNGLEIDRSGIVHRLDKDTSGIMVVARNQIAYEFLKEQFKSRQTEKSYMAVVHGRVNKDRGVIDSPIGRSQVSFRKRAIKNFLGQGRDAITEYEVVERFAPRLGAPEGYSLLLLHPKTGRTHQIRVHCMSIGHPVVCDRTYSPQRACPSEIGRLALHAVGLKISLPQTGPKEFYSPMPADIDNFCKVLRVSK